MITIALCAALVGTVVVCFIRVGQAPDPGAHPRLRLLPWVSAALTLGVTLIAHWQDNRSSDQSINEQFETTVKSIQNAVVDRQRSYQEMVVPARDLLASQKKFDPSALADYVRSAKLDIKHPNVGGIGFAAYVPNARLARFLGRARQMTDVNFHIFPSGERTSYGVIEVAEPSARLNALLGYDLGTDSEAKAAMENARSRPMPTLSHRLSLPDDPQHSAFMYLFPVMRSPSDADAEGSSDLRGWVFARFRADQFFKGIVKEQQNVELQVFDGAEVSMPGLFFDSAGFNDASNDPPKGALSATQQIEVGGRPLTLRFSAQPGFGATRSQPKRSSWVFGFGALITLLTLGLDPLLRMSKRRPMRIPKEKELGLGSDQRNAIISGGSEGVVIVDALEVDQPIVWVSKRFEKITGYSANEIQGQNCRILQGDDRDQKGLKELRSAMHQARETTVSLRNYRKDSTPFWNELHISPIRNRAGEVTQWVGHLRDVTERELTERRLNIQMAIIRAIWESPSIEDAALRILQAMCEGNEWELGAFWEMDPRTQVLRCIQSWHHPDINSEEFDIFARDTTLPRDVGLPGLVWGKSEPVFFPELEKAPGFPETEIVGRLGLVSGCGFPLTSRRGFKGVLAFYGKKMWPLNKNLLLLMVTAGNQISQFMERQQSEGQQQEKVALERGLAEFMGDGLVAMDRQGFCIYANSAAGKLLGYGAPLMVGQNLHTLLHPEDAMGTPCDAYNCPVLQSLQSTRPCHIEDHQMFYTRDRVAVPVSYTTAPIIDQGLIRGVVINMVDVTERRKETDALQRALRAKDEELRAVLSAGPSVVAVTSKPSMPISGVINLGPAAGPTEPRPEAQQVDPSPWVPSEASHDFQRPKVDEAVIESEAIPDKTFATGPEIVNLEPVAVPSARRPVLLLIEENETARAGAWQALRQVECEVLQAASPQEALQLAERSPDAIDLLITDCILSQMSGRALADKIRDFHKEVKVLFLSSYSLQAIQDLGLLEGSFEFLQKPLNAAVFQSRVNSILDL